MLKVRRNREEEEGEGGHDTSGGMRWLLTYSDLITLLMAFFIVMYAMSQIDTAKYQALAKALGEALAGTNYIGLEGETGPPAVSPPEAAEVNPAPQDALQELTQDMTNYFDTHGLKGKVTLFLSDQYLNVSFTGSVLFDLGKADFRPDALPVLKEVAGYLRRVPNYVGVAGSTDDLKIATAQFPSNWELSVTRATTVVRYLVEQEGLDPHRFLALGYGEYHPLFPNTSEENRRKNRRIDIIIYRSPPFFLGNAETATPH